MKYMGSKSRIAKYILPIMLKSRKEGQYWVEPFVGGANLIDKVNGNRIGSDTNKYIIALLKYMQNPIVDIPLIPEKEYITVKNNIENYPEWYIGYVGYQLSFSSQFFSSYRKDNIGKRNYAKEAKQNIEKQCLNIKDITFFNLSYELLEIPKNSLIYCDPPYENTASYKNTIKFNHIKFYEWVRAKVKEGHIVFISEYQAPSDFKCIWSKTISNGLTKSNNSERLEKLYIHQSQIGEYNEVM